MEEDLDDMHPEDSYTEPSIKVATDRAHFCSCPLVFIGLLSPAASTYHA